MPPVLLLLVLRRSMRSSLAQKALADFPLSSRVQDHCKMQLLPRGLPLWCQVITGHVLLQLLQMLLMHACARGKRLLNCQRVRATVVSSLDCCMLAKVRAREWVVLDAISG